MMALGRDRAGGDPRRARAMPPPAVKAQQPMEFWQQIAVRSIEKGQQM